MANLTRPPTSKTTPSFLPSSAMILMAILSRGVVASRKRLERWWLLVVAYPSGVLLLPPPDYRIHMSFSLSPAS